MVDKTQIQATLVRIEDLYQIHIVDYRGNYFAKLFIIEACGWIEECMDEIVQHCAAKHLNDDKNIAFVDDLIKNNHSFRYASNFRNMLIQILGIINVERLENTYDQDKFAIMCSSLGLLKQRRDDLAHTYIKGTLQTIDAPSVTKDRFAKACDGLEDIETCIRKLQF